MLIKDKKIIGIILIALLILLLIFVFAFNNYNVVYTCASVICQPDNVVIICDSTNSSNLFVDLC